MKRYYLDHAATTPLDSRVLDAMMPFLKEQYGNPSSMHDMGIQVKKAINDARSSIARLLNVHPKGVIFTSGGTEATNLALRGFASKHKEKKEIITSVIEHHATLNAIAKLEEEGYLVHRIQVDQEGFIDIEELKKKLNVNTLCVSIIMANNEIGTIQDIETIGYLCHQYQTILHVDAVQMIAHEVIRFDQLPIDMLTLSAHKFYGPKGIGALIIKEDIEIDPILYGGHQEMGLRSGTENVYAIMGLAKALELVYQEQSDRYKNCQLVETAFRKKLSDEVNTVYFNGPNDASKRLPGLVSVSFEGVKSQAFAFSLNRKGIYVSTGSACLSNEILESHVLKAIGIKDHYGSIRFSFGKDSKLSDLDQIVHIIKEVYEDMKE